jgi:DNA-binding Lrp family transcriptional regulator
VTIGGISHQSIAHALGATRQAVSKVLKELEQDGVVRLDYRRITIQSLARLELDNDKLISSNLAVPDYRQGASPPASVKPGAVPAERGSAVSSVRKGRRTRAQD